MGQYLVRRGTNGWMIWDRAVKRHAMAFSNELTNFKSAEQAEAVLRLYLARGALIEFENTSESAN